MSTLAKKTLVSVLLGCTMLTTSAFAGSESIKADQGAQVDMAFFSFATSNSDIYGYNDDLKIFFLKQRFNHFRNLG